jgi:hypothetical protein
MRTPKGYTDKTQLEDYLLITIDTSFVAQVNDWIAKIEAYIDRIAGRSFKADSTASARYYDGDGTDLIIIDDCAEITSVTVDGTAVTNFLKYPKNKTYTSRIVLPDNNRFTKGRQNVIVTGKWGYSTAVPADIEFAATVLVAGIINANYKTDGNKSSETIDNYQVSYKSEKQITDFEEAKKIIAGYHRISI